MGRRRCTVQEPSLGEKIAEFYKDIDDKLHRLDSIIERLELIPVSSSATTARPSSELADTTSKTKTRKVFIVHGHDEVAKTNLEVFLNEIGLQPIVLHRQADEGLKLLRSLRNTAMLATLSFC